MSLYNTRTLLSHSPTTAATVVGDPHFISASEEGKSIVSAQASFVFGSGGTACKAYVQTSLDGGLTWFDIMCFTFVGTTAKKISAVKMWTALAAAYAPTDGTLTDDTIKDGVLGDRLRCKCISTGTYAGSTTINVFAVVQ